MTDTAQPNAEPTQSNADQDRAGGQQATPEPKFTQDDLNFYLGKEKAEIQRKYSDYDELKAKAAKLDELKQAELTELEKLQQQLADKDAEIMTARQQAETERLNALRLRVGQEVGLPPVLAARLQGADEAALKEDAEAVKAVLGTQQAHIPNINATAGGGQQHQRTSVKLTPAQKAIADEYGIAYDKYAESLHQFEE